jgi:hypothetical protein
MTIQSQGCRIELVPMDEHCHDITIALYRRDLDGRATGLVHTYSSRAGAPERVAFVTRAMAVLGGLEVDGDTGAVGFDCGSWHEAAIRRAFLEACKLATGAVVAARPLAVEDRRTGQQITVERLGGGSYRVHAEGATDEEPSRAPGIANGLVKLGQLTAAEDGVTVSFPCGCDHDDLVGLLLPRALNVRAVLREEEAIASRGVLAAPSAQES